MIPDADYAAGLTKYNTDDFTLYIHNDGKVYWHQKAGARMLGMQQGHLSSILNRGSVKGESLGQVLRFENAAQYGIEGESFYDVATLVTLAKLYSPKLAEKFMEAGANMYLYQLAGYKVAFQPTAGMSDRQRDERALAALTQKIALNSYSEAYPNFKAKVDFIVENNGALGGKMTLNEFNDSQGVSMNLSEKKAVGRGMAEMTRKETGESPTTRTVKTPKPKGGYSYIQVKEYPVSLMPEYQSLVRQRGIVNN